MVKLFYYINVRRYRSLRLLTTKFHCLNNSPYFFMSWILISRKQHTLNCLRVTRRLFSFYAVYLRKLTWNYILLLINRNKVNFYISLRAFDVLSTNSLAIEKGLRIAQSRADFSVIRVDPPGFYTRACTVRTCPTTIPIWAVFGTTRYHEHCIVRTSTEHVIQLTHILTEKRNAPFNCYL